MDSSASSSDRVAVIATLAARWRQGDLGRTKLVKCAYFLQTLRNVPLGYDFSLYSYGPYDSVLLRDLDYANALGEVEVTMVQYSGGYGYEIGPGESDSDRNKFAKKHLKDIEWVIEHFGELSPAEMELASTIVFADREKKRQRVDTLAETVRKIKPHFSLAKVREQIGLLKEQQLISVD